jgi:hypothetical protein
MKFFFQFAIASMFLLLSNSSSAAAISPEPNNKPTPPEDVTVTLCISGGGWEICVSVEITGIVKGNTFNGTGTINEKTKEVVVTGLPQTLYGKQIVLKEAAKIVRTGETRSSSNTITLKPGTFKVDATGRMAVPYSPNKVVNK